MKPYRFDSGLGHSLRQFASTGADCLFFYCYYKLRDAQFAGEARLTLTMTQSKICALRIFGRFSRGRRFTVQSGYVKCMLRIWGVRGMPRQ